MEIAGYDVAAWGFLFFIVAFPATAVWLLLLAVRWLLGGGELDGNHWLRGRWGYILAYVITLIGGYAVYANQVCGGSAGGDFCF